MTELQTLLAALLKRGTRLSLERTRIVSDVGGLVPFNRFWLGGPVVPGDWEQLKRLKSAVVAELEQKGLFEMSSGDTQDRNAEPVSVVSPPSVATVATIQRGRTWQKESDRSREKRKARETPVTAPETAKTNKEASPPKKASETPKIAEEPRVLRLVSGRIWQLQNRENLELANEVPDSDLKALEKASQKAQESS